MLLFVDHDDYDYIYEVGLRDDEMSRAAHQKEKKNYLYLLVKKKKKMFRTFLKLSFLH